MYCIVDDIKKYLAAEIVQQVETTLPGLIDGHIADICGEIDDRLRGRYILPLSFVPSVLNRCAAVLTAYRTLGGITGVMDTDKTTENALYYLQKQATSVEKLLEQIATGELKLGLEEAKADAGTTDNELLASFPRRQFDFRGY